jgi:hypothetical protein
MADGPTNPRVKIVFQNAVAKCLLIMSCSPMLWGSYPKAGSLRGDAALRASFLEQVTREIFRRKNSEPLAPVHGDDPPSMLDLFAMMAGLHPDQPSQVAQLQKRLLTTEGNWDGHAGVVQYSAIYRHHRGEI